MLREVPSLPNDAIFTEDEQSYDSPNEYHHYRNRNPGDNADGRTDLILSSLPFLIQLPPFLNTFSDLIQIAAYCNDCKWHDKD